MICRLGNQKSICSCLVPLSCSRCTACNHTEALLDLSPTSRCLQTRCVCLFMHMHAYATQYATLKFSVDIVIYYSNHYAYSRALHHPRHHAIPRPNPVHPTPVMCCCETSLRQGCRCLNYNPRRESELEVVCGCEVVKIQD